MKLSKKLNEIYADKRNRHLSLFLKACEEELVNDEWGRPLSMSHQHLTDQEVLYLVDWWKKKQSERKYTIKVFPSSVGYLNSDDSYSKVFASTLAKFDDCRTSFTKQEIEQFKQRDDIAIDWNKAKIEPVEEE
ncbi:MAG TPA: hypothetical protein H9958_09520 [Candidatus Limosilactobacillus intestinavium]|nr:hypothetical protein [Candidatus Limosilactobacillus intestinavium]